MNTSLDPHKDDRFVQRDDTHVEFGGNTPSGGKFAEPWDMHGWTGDPKHSGDLGFKIRSNSCYDGKPSTLVKTASKDSERAARVQKEAEKCTPSDEDDDDFDDDDEFDDDEDE